MKLVVLITAQTEKGFEVVQAWREVGVPGATVIRSHGIHALQETIKRGGFEMHRMAMSMASIMADMIESVEQSSVVILSLVRKEMIEEMTEIANDILGDLEQPEHGIFFVIPIESAIGLYDHSKNR